MPPGCIAPFLPSALPTSLQSRSAAKEGAVRATSAQTIERRKGSITIMVSSSLVARTRRAGSPPRRSIQLLQIFLEGLALDQRDLRDGLCVFEYGDHAHGAITAVCLDRSRHRVVERDLCLRHCLALLLRVLQIVAVCDLLLLFDSARSVVNDDFGELAALGGVDGKLQRSILDLVFAGDRLAFARARLEPTFQRHFRLRQRLGERRRVLVPFRRERGQPGKAKSGDRRQRDSSPHVVRPHLTNTQSGCSRGKPAKPMAAVAATSSGLLTLQRNRTPRLPMAMSAVSQSPMAILPSSTAAPRI